MASTNDAERKDWWDSKTYNSVAGYVPKLTTTVVSYLDPQPNDSILDIGCGDGSLTAQIAKSSARVLGVDASKSFIETAKSKYAAQNLKFLLHDANDLQNCAEAVTGNWDKAFSNAAMHWILADPSVRKKFFVNVNKALKPGGKFVFEMGGAGNVAEIQAASLAALLHAGVPLEKARKAWPNYFPSVDWMRNTLVETGFEVEKIEMEYRPTATPSLEGWIRLMCAQSIEVVEEKKREQVVKEMCDVLQTIVAREDGSQSLGYVRLRAVARKL